MRVTKSLTIGVSKLELEPLPTDDGEREVELNRRVRNVLPPAKPPLSSVMSLLLRDVEAASSALRSVVSHERADWHLMCFTALLALRDDPNMAAAAFLAFVEYTHPLASPRLPVQLPSLSSLLWDAGTALQYLLVTHKRADLTKIMECASVDELGAAVLRACSDVLDMVRQSLGQDAAQCILVSEKAVAAMHQRALFPYCNSPKEKLQRLQLQLSRAKAVVQQAPFFEQFATHLADQVAQQQQVLMLLGVNGADVICDAADRAAAEGNEGLTEVLERLIKLLAHVSRTEGTRVLIEALVEAAQGGDGAQL